MAGQEHQVEITVTDILGKGTCPLGLKKGDKFLVTGAETVEYLCGWAFQSIFPFLTVLRFGGEFPWEGDKDTAVVCCPDPNNPVVFTLKRLESK